MTTLECRSLRKSYRGRSALDEVTLSAAAGEIVGLIGPNGAGKTTLLRILAGELRPDGGEAVVCGAAAGTRQARMQVGFASDPPVAPAELSGVEWLSYLASHRARTPAARLELVRSAVGLGGLAEFVGRRIGEYSRGMAQRLALAAAALCGARLLLLDEVLSGADPLVSRELRDGIARLGVEGRTVIVASHDLATVERLATRVAVLVRGRVVRELPMAALLSQRVAELTLSAAGLVSVERLLTRFPGSVRTGGGVEVPLTSGLTIEQVLGECRAQRIAVAGTRIRYRGLEDILVEAVRQ